MKIGDLYDKYQIMPQLAEHQLRVGGIAKLVTEGWKSKEEARKSVLACLVHDMGNIVKFDDKIGEKWIKVREEIRQKYGADAHSATCAILNEAGLSEYAKYMEEEAEMYGKSGLTLLDFQTCSRPALMIMYADLRVVPSGVVSLEERIQDLENRYGKPRFERQWDKVFEGYIKTLSVRNPASINESDVTPLFDEMLTMDI